MIISAEPDRICGGSMDTHEVMFSFNKPSLKQKVSSSRVPTLPGYSYTVTLIQTLTFYSHTYTNTHILQSHIYKH